MSLRAKRRLAGAVSLAAIAALSVLMFVYRDAIASYANAGYVAVGLVCFALNAGVFGLSPSGIVAVQASFLFDPLLTALAAGLGAGLGEVISYFAGRSSAKVVDVKHADFLRSLSPARLALVSFAASFLSGNLSDGVGVVCGRMGKPLAFYLAGAVSAKIAKMVVLVFGARYLADSLAGFGAL
ncbi:VTT domain-containing protein [Arabiibacter massiliensis]|uniref:VTT domain-containing protein n=1 Tax=Arabiibacter massiliensis TaxID=1870985 RepID=UPI00117B87D3|nr:VTT domain-containing protein [Arabiibacter massiliensis]